MREGKLVLLLSDRYLVQGKLPIHALLATGAVHHRLVETGLRCKCNLLVETGTARDAHHFACLIGYGATAVYPYMAYQTLYEMMRKGQVKLGSRSGASSGAATGAASARACTRSCRRWASRPSRATAARSCSRSWDCRARWWSCASATPRAASKAPTSTISKATRAIWRCAPGIRACGVEQGGIYKYVHGGEYHMYNPDVVGALQAAVVSGDYEHYQLYARW